MLKNLKLIVSKWSESSTIHAIPNISKTNNTLVKIIWILSFLFSAALCFYVITKSIQNYYEYNVVTKIRLIDENPIVFPTVSFCNLNPFVTQESKDFLKTIIESDEFKNQTYLSDLYIYKYKTKVKYFSKFYKIQTIVASLNDTIKKSLGFEFDKFVTSCLYNSIPCDKNDFVWYYDVLFGNCYRFNSGKYENGSENELKYLNKVGFLNGLVLDLFVSDNNSPLSISNGAIVFIHNDKVIPGSREGFTVNTGTLTNILVSKSYTSKLAYPYSECKNSMDLISSSLYDKVIDMYGTYRRTDCLHLCYQREVNLNCSCYDTNYRPFNNDTKPCSSLNQTLCLFNVVTIFDKETNKLCSEECPSECESMLYKHSISTSQFPPKAYADELLNDTEIISKFDKSRKIDYEYLKENMLSLNVYFDSHQSTHIVENKQIEFEDLVANVGGTLGLFLGISLLSFIEIIELIIEIFFVLKKKIQNN